MQRFGDDLCIFTGEDFVCVLDASGDEGQVFDPCEFANMTTDQATECDPNAGGCCLPLCDLEDPDFVCPGVGQSCLSIYAEGMAPEEFSNVGICVLPP